MKVALNKKSVLIIFISCALTILSFPFIAEATEIEIGEDNRQEENIGEENIAGQEEGIEVKTEEEIEDNIEREEIEDEVDIEDEEEWEIVIIDEPLPVTDQTISQIKFNNPENPLPITVLPKTGELNSVPLSGLGVIMIYLGIYASRKKV